METVSGPKSSTREVLGGCLFQIECPVLEVGCWSQELASLLVDLEIGGTEGNVLLPSAQVLSHLQLQPLPYAAQREDHGVEGAGGVEDGVERLPWLPPSGC